MTITEWLNELYQLVCDNKDTLGVTAVHKHKDFSIPLEDSNLFFEISRCEVVDDVHPEFRRYTISCFIFVKFTDDIDVAREKTIGIVESLEQLFNTATYIPDFSLVEYDFAYINREKFFICEIEMSTIVT